MPSLEALTEQIRLALQGQSGLGKSIKLDLKGEGFVHVDGANVTNGDHAADLVVTEAAALLRLAPRAHA